jgi:hypothetical protein
LPRSDSWRDACTGLACLSINAASRSINISLAGLPNFDLNQNVGGFPVVEVADHGENRDAAHHQR